MCVCELCCSWTESVVVSMPIVRHGDDFPKGVMRSRSSRRSVGGGIGSSNLLRNDSSIRSWCLEWSAILYYAEVGDPDRFCQREGTFRLSSPCAWFRAIIEL